MVRCFGDKSGMFVSDDVMPEVCYPGTILYYVKHEFHLYLVISLLTKQTLGHMSIFCLHRNRPVSF